MVYLGNHLIRISHDSFAVSTLLGNPFSLFSLVLFYCAFPYELFLFEREIELTCARPRIGRHVIQSPLSVLMVHAVGKPNEKICCHVIEQGYVDWDFIEMTSVFYRVYRRSKSVRETVWYQADVCKKCFIFWQSSFPVKTAGL